MKTTIDPNTSLDQQLRSQAARDKFAAQRHAAREREQKAHQRASAHEKLLGAVALAHEQHPSCALGDLYLRVEAKSDLFEFMCVSCQQAIEVSGVTASVRGGSL